MGAIMTDSKIQWTDRSDWNPVRGCSRVSLGCGGPHGQGGCYAEKIAARFSGEGQPFEGFAKRGPARWTGKVALVPEKLGLPLRWRNPARIFACSMADLFHEKLSNEDIAAVFGVMAACPQHTFQVLTKRPERMLAWMGWMDNRSAGCHIARAWQDAINLGVADHKQWRGAQSWPLPNVWLGVSAENQETADARIPLLLQTPAAVRFVSYEPALEYVDFGLQNATCSCCSRWPSRWVRLVRPVASELPMFLQPAGLIADPGTYRATGNQHGALSVLTPGGLLGIKPAEFECLPALDWIIIGGESGPGARPCNVAWIRSAVQQCKAADVACFVKQLGAVVRVSQNEPLTANLADVEVKPAWVGHDVLKLRDRKGGDPSEWPNDLRVREFPQ